MYNTIQEKKSKQLAAISIRSISYWITTALLALVVMSGAIAELGHLGGTLETVILLGYPTYFLSILGSWKILGGIAILVPGFPRLKEWAYAGIFFEMTGAALSHAACHDYGVNGMHIIVTLLFAALTVASWALRPASRKL
ncbi:MAG TPA: DoxX family protein [Flavipsychrobacter sp.]|nr:DoxX family protein [Flavipsychrobacter sp.]